MVCWLEDGRAIEDVGEKWKEFTRREGMKGTETGEKKE